MKLTERQKIVYALKKTPKIGCIKGNNILSSVDSIDAEGFFSDLAIKFPTEYPAIRKAFEETDFATAECEMEEKGIVPVAVCDDEYPKILLPYRDAPLILYCKGDRSLLEEESIAVIGTRFPTRYGIRVTEDFAAALAEKFVIVSGMARGVDSCAHRAALNVGGKTVAVLGCGVDIVYPPENFALYRDIISNGGLVISEYEPGTGAIDRNFPARNRIISGLSSGVLVTEAGRKSGTTLTVNSATAQGKDVFCVPGSIYSEASDGVNDCIKKGKGRAVTSPADVFEAMGIKSKRKKAPVPLQLDFNQEAVLNALKSTGEMHVEELLDVVDVNISQLNSLLVKMEAAGLINKTKHNYWSV